MSIGIRNRNSIGYCKLITGCIGGAALAVAYRMGAIGPAFTAIGAIGCLWAIAPSRNTSKERSVEIVDPPADYAIGFHYVVKREGNIIGDIIGSHHLDEINHKRLNPTIEEAVKQASVVAFEASPAWVNWAEEQKKVLEMNGYVEDYLAFHRKNFDVSKIIGSSALKKMPSLENYLDTETGTETLIMQKANVPTVISLETTEEKARAKIYLEQEDTIWRDHESKGLISKGNHFLPLLRAYQRGDEALFKKQQKWINKISPAYAKLFLENRNIPMTARAVPLLQNATPEERALIAVGCAHLFGKKGMISLLKESLGTEYSIEKA
jgi:TraB family protein